MHTGAQVGAYRIIEKLGAGGMGTVWVAEHMMLGRKAALKVLHADMSMRRDIVRRFFNEARAAAAIRDPGIVQIFDFGYHEDGSAYIVMELLDGETLEHRMDRTGTLEVIDALRVMRQVAAAVGAAHAAGIVHRDLKPDNIFLARDPEVAGGERAKILDFGIAKLVDDYKASQTPSGVLGTPLYMSPEQCRGRGNVDQRTDIYALGCVLFALLCGRPPFSGGAGEVLAMHLSEPPPAPSSRASNIPPAVDQLVLRCLAKQADQRFSSGIELARAITEVLASLRAATGPAEPPVTGAEVPPRRPSARPSDDASITSAPTTSSRPVRRRYVVPAAAGGAAIVAIAIIIIWRATGDSAAEVVASPAPTPTPPVIAPPPPPPRTDPPPPDPHEQLTETVTQILQKFVDWSQTHKGSACPDLATLDGSATDPWGTPFVLTCTDQPHNQIVGVISAGPDRTVGTEDDIGSWQLDRRVTDLVHGAPWVAVAHEKAHKKPQPHPKVVPPKPDQPTITLDENGVPIHR